LNDFLPTYSRWVLKFGHIFSCHHFFHYDLRYWLDFWYVSILMSYRSSFNFVPIEWFWANLRTLDY
jgi:hypothetical protein